MDATESESPPILAARRAVFSADPVSRARVMASGTMLAGLSGKYPSAILSASRGFMAARSEYIFWMNHAMVEEAVEEVEEARLAASIATASTPAGGWPSSAAETAPATATAAPMASGPP